MTAQIVYQNCLGEHYRPAVLLPDRRRRRLSTIVARHAPKDRHVFVSVHRRGELIRPQDHNVRLAKRHYGYEGPTWSETLVGPNDVVAFTTIALGGGDSNAKQIGSALALIALVLAASFIVGPAALGLTGWVATAAKTGIVVAGAALISLAAKPKSASDDRQLYGISGGGNLPRKGDRVPAWHGKHWSTPDLSQPDYFVYDGEDMILYKRLCCCIGPLDVTTIKIATATMWTQAGGVQAPFNGAPGGSGAGQMGSGNNAASGGGTEVEIIQPGETSTLVPGSVYSSPSVSGAEVPRAADNPSYAGPFAVCPVGTETDTIQIDYSYPDGAYHEKQTSKGEDPIPLGVLFEYAPCDDDDLPTGVYITLHSDTTTTKSTKGLRFTRILPVTMGRYVVRARNTRAANNETKDRLTWDGLRAHFHDTILRPCTEIALKIRSGKNLGITAFGEVWVEGTGIKQTWNGSTWVAAPTRKAVYAYKDILQSEYGGNLSDNEVDLAAIKSYASGLSERDTFDSLIRGPVSVYGASSTALAVMRAEPTRIGNTWSINRDEAKDIRKHKFTRRQMARDSSSVQIELDRSNGEADIIVEYNIEGDPRRRSDTRVTYGSESLTPRRVNGTGISDFDHAYKHAQWLAAAANYRRETHKFTAELQGRMVQRGDYADIDTWFISDGRAGGVLARDDDDLILILDTDMVFDGDTYMTVRDRIGRDWGPVLVTEGAASNIVIADAADVAAAETESGVLWADLFADDDEDMTSVVAGPLLVDRFIISSVQPQGKEHVAIEAILDNDSVYTDLGEDPPDTPDPPSNGDLPDPDQAIVAWVSARCIQKATGLFMEWAVCRARGASAYVVRLSYDDGTSWETVNDGLSTDGSHALRHEEGVSVKVGAYAVNLAGVPGPAVYTTFTTSKTVFDSGNSEIDGAAIDVGSIVTAALADAAVTAAKLADAAVTATKFAAAIEPVALGNTLPSPIGYTGPRLFFDVDDEILYRYVSGAWETGIDTIDAADVTGQLVAAQIADGAINTAKFAAGITPVEIVGTLPTTGNFDGRQVFLTTDKKLYRYNASTAAFISTTAAADVTGTLTNSQIADLAAAKLTGQITTTQITDGGITTPKIAAGAVVTASLAADSVTASKIAVGSGSLNLITNGDFEEGIGAPPGWFANTGGAGFYSLETPSITPKSGSKAALLNRAAAGVDIECAPINFSPVEEGVTYAAQVWAMSDVATATGFTFAFLWYTAAGVFISQTPIVADGALTTAYQRLTGLAVAPATAKKAKVYFLHTAPTSAAYIVIDAVVLQRAVGTTLIEDGAITTSKITAGSITAIEIAADTITAGQIAAGAISTSELAAGAVTAVKIAAGTITANEIAALTILSGNIAAGQITTAKLAAGAVTANEVAANTITAGQIAAGAISTTQLAAGAVTTTILAAGAVTAGKFATNRAFENLAVNGSFEDGLTGWTTYTEASGTVFTQTTDVQSGAVAIICDRGQDAAGTGAAGVLTIGLIPAVAGETFEITARVQGGGSATGVYLFINCYDSNGSIVGVTYQSFAVSNGPAGAWATTRGVATALPDTKFIKVGVLYNSTATARYLYVDSVTCKRQTGTTLIEDGAITADKIIAGAITSSHISAGAIVAGKIAAGAINAATIIVDELIVTGHVADNAITVPVAASGTSAIALTNGGPGQNPQTIFSEAISVTQINGKPYKIAVVATALLEFQNPNTFILSGVIKITPSGGSTTTAGRWRWNGGDTFDNMICAAAFEYTGNGAAQSYTIEVVLTETQGGSGTAWITDRFFTAQAAKR